MRAVPDDVLLCFPLLTSSAPLDHTTSHNRAHDDEASLPSSGLQECRSPSSLAVLLGSMRYPRGCSAHSKDQVRKAV